MAVSATGSLHALITVDRLGSPGPAGLRGARSTAVVARSLYAASHGSIPIVHSTGMGAMCFMPRLTDGMESSWSHKMPRASFCCTRCERSWTPAVSRVRRNAWRIRPRVRRSPPRHLAVAGRRARGISVGSRVLSPARGVARHTRPAPAAASPRIRPARPATTRPRGDPAGRHARQAGARPGRRDRARCPSRHSPPDPAAVVSMMRWSGRPPGVAGTPCRRRKPGAADTPRRIAPTVLAT